MADVKPQLVRLAAALEELEALRELLHEHPERQLVVRRRVLRSVPDIAMRRSRSPELKAKTRAKTRVKMKARGKAREKEKAKSAAASQ